MKSSKRMIAQVVALVVSSMGATMAMAAGTPVLLGGGSSLVAPTIQSEISAFPAADGSISYSSVGSGAGQSAFLLNSASFLSATGTVDFANSDAALSASQISAYTAAGGLGVTNGPLIQIPYIITPITIPLVNAPAGTGPAFPGGAKTVALNDDDLCGIFSGKITNWSSVVNPAVSPASTYGVNAPIKVVYRTDGSGTTDLLTRHLAAVCTTGATGNSAITFTETQNFASLFTTLPSNFIGESGSGGVANELVTLGSASTAAVGYLSPDYTNTFLASASLPAQTNKLPVASLFNRFTNTSILPTAANATTAVGTITAPTGSAAANPANWVPNSGNPSVGYPISGTSQIILSQCYANANSTSPSPATAIIDFLTTHYGNSTIVKGNGFALPTGIVADITNDFLSNANGLNLDIGNTSVCTGSVTGR